VRGKVSTKGKAGFGRQRSPTSKEIQMLVTFVVSSTGNGYS